MKSFIKSTFFVSFLCLGALAAVAQAANIAIATGAVGRDTELMRTLLDRYEAQSDHKVEIVTMPASTTDQFGQYKIWLSARSSDIDIYMVDVIWAPQIDNHLVDLTQAAADVSGQHFPAIIESQTVNGKLVAIPFFTDAPALYYRTDLLAKYGKTPPQTWDEMTQTATEIMNRERASGNSALYGFVFQGNSYEGLTCDALEWIKSYGGGQIIEPDGRISVNNAKARLALTKAASWVGTIAPEGVTTYQEEEARGLWQRGDAVFMRNWPYAYSLGQQAADSAVKGKMGVVPLPTGGAGSAATLGGWNLAVSRYSKNQQEAIDVIKFLASQESQKYQAVEGSKMPTIPSLYRDADVLAAVPFFADWLDVLAQAVPRPSAPTKRKYNEVSKEFWTAAHNVLTKRASAQDSLATLEKNLKRIRGRSW